MLEGQVEATDRVDHDLQVQVLALAGVQLSLGPGQRRLELPLALLGLAEQLLRHPARRDPHRQDLVERPRRRLLGLRELRAQLLDAAPKRIDLLAGHPVGLLDRLGQQPRVARRLADDVEHQVVGALRPDLADRALVAGALLDADAAVVVVAAASPVRRRRGQRAATGAAHHPGQQVLVLRLRRRPMHPSVPLHHGGGPLEDVAVDDRVVLPLEHLPLVLDLAEEQPVLEQSLDATLRERPPALRPLAAGDVRLLAVPLLVEPLRQRHRRPQLDVLVEDEPHKRRLGVVDDQVPVARRVVAQRRVPAVPQPAGRPRLHRGSRPLGGLFPLELGEDQNQLEHRAADGAGGVEGLVERHELDAVVLEQPVHLVEVEQRAGQPVDPGDHHQVDVAAAHPREQLLERRAVEGLAGLALLAEDVAHVVVPRARGQRGAEPGLLGVERALVLGGLEVGGDPAVEGDADGVGRLGNGGGWHHRSRGSCSWLRYHLDQPARGQDRPSLAEGPVIRFLVKKT